MLVTMVAAALLVDGVFSLLGLIPTGPRPSRADVFGKISVDYKLVLNVLGTLVFATLLSLAARRPSPHHAHMHHEHAHAAG
jgi:hypothetical protein